MEIIFLRGLPGTGKTAIAEILNKIFRDSEVICVDKFKLQEMKKGKNPKESRKVAYEKTLEKLNSFYKQGKEKIIVEELMTDKDFYNKLKNFVIKTNSKDYWFRILRPLNELLKVESTRKRKIKNSKEDFEELKKDIEACEIENEICIKNDYLPLTIKNILEILLNQKT